MTIKEYYSNYASNKKYCIRLQTGKNAIIDEFYNDVISKNVLPSKDILAWHKMLMEYIERPNAVYWMRYYESGTGRDYKKQTGHWDNRRACMTTVGNKWQYAFVSNFDVHEILNMICHGVKPDVDEFAELMENRQFPLHYDTNKISEESEIACFPKIGLPQYGVLTDNHLYLAHIHGVNQEKYFFPNGTVVDCSKAKSLFPNGNLSDWTDAGGYMLRKMSFSTKQENDLALAIAKAHFLRFTDPLNYYVVPGKKYSRNTVCSNIGEYLPLNIYMEAKYEALYGKDVMDEFRKAACFARYNGKATGDEVINIEYSPIKNFFSSITTAPVSIKLAAKNTAKSGVKNIKTGGSGIGKYAREVFTTLLKSNKLTPNQIKNLMDKSYCKSTFNMNYPVLADVSKSYEKNKYYVDSVGPYVITNDWFLWNRKPLDNWLTDSGLTI